VIGSPGGDDVVSAVAGEAELREGAGQIGAAVDEGAQAGHVPASRPGRVMANNSEDAADISAPAILPAVYEGDFQTGDFQHVG
jgi:hypothetical protein